MDKKQTDEHFFILSKVNRKIPSSPFLKQRFHVRCIYMRVKSSANLLVKSHIYIATI